MEQSNNQEWIGRQYLDSMLGKLRFIAVSEELCEKFKCSSIILQGQSQMLANRALFPV
jgi:hypothetical protein